MTRLSGRCAVVLGLLGFGNGRRLAHLSFFLVLMGYWVASSSGSAERVGPTGLPIVFAVFCLLLYAGIYLLNDLLDLPLDRLHPVKRRRLVASGRVPVRLAWVLALSLVGVGLAASFALSTTSERTRGYELSVM